MGTESQYGDFSEVTGSREVVMKIAAKHPDMSGIGILLKEAVGLGLATPPGLSGFAGSRPSPHRWCACFPAPFPRSRCRCRSCWMMRQSPAMRSTAKRWIPQPFPARHPSPRQRRQMVEVPLIALAWGRSGDKGNKANIGIIARRPDYLPYICAALTEAVVTSASPTFWQTPPGQCRAFLLPGSNAINFLLHDVLGGGGVASIRNDPQGKGYAQLLLSCPIPVPAAIAESLS